MSNILFLTLSDLSDIDVPGIYTDLVQTFIQNNENVYIISALQKREKKKTHVLNYKNCKILKLEIGNITKTNPLLKGINMISIERKYIGAIKEYFSDIKFDMVLYATPPITFERVVRYVKKRDNAVSYLMLKDIFPQNALDLGMLSKKGFKRFITNYFNFKEKNLYENSDIIGCMTQNNVNYIKDNYKLKNKIIEICPNSFYPRKINKIEKEEKEIVLNKYGIPLNKVIFLYGGNLGKPQGIELLISFLKMQKLESAHFLIIGSGTEFNKLENLEYNREVNNLTVLKSLNKQDYLRLMGAAHVGMIFLDGRFTIPNFPSRILDYLSYSIPILAVTDLNCDLSYLLNENRLGLWSRASIEDYELFESNIKDLLRPEIRNHYSENSYSFLVENFNSFDTYKTIIKHLEK